MGTVYRVSPAKAPRVTFPATWSHVLYEGLNIFRKFAGFSDKTGKEIAMEGLVKE